MEEENIAVIRKKIYDKVISDYSEEEKAIFDDLVGRNVELAFISLQVCKTVGIDMHKQLQVVLNQKQADEDIPDAFYIESLKELISEKLDMFHSIKDWLLTKGDFAEQHYYPKNALFADFVRYLRDKSIPTIGTNTFNSLLRELSFVENFNIKNQKHSKNKTSVRCLIFDKTVLKKVGWTPIVVEGGLGDYEEKKPEEVYLIEKRRNETKKN